ncbi:MAG: hypothetical protein IJU99_04655 [Lachnospiraceae bacterium]|nr:hypothetical protein [Lachnospiraceae bacterium]
MSEKSDTLLRELLQHPELIGQAVGFKDLTAIHGLWMREMIMGTEDYTLQAHRGSYKSSCLSVVIVLLMILFPDRNIIFLRKADNDVSEMVQMVSKILRTEIMQDITNMLHRKSLEIPSESMSHLSTNLWQSPMGAPQLLGIGLRASITGKHAFYVITDDICNLTDRLSRAERERTKIQYDELQNIRNRGGRIINLGTPWHKEDVFSHMPNIHRYDCYTTGLISPQKLKELRASMAPSLFAANYELKHIASSDALFTTAPVFFSDEEKLQDGIAHIDAAYGGEDWTAFTCGNVKEDGCIYLYGRLWHAHVSKVLPEILEIAGRLRCLPVYVENNGDKGFLAKEIMDKDIWARPYDERENKFIKIASYLHKWWPDIRFLEGTDREYLDQIMDYTEDAEHDDAPDSAACVCRILNKKATLYRKFPQAS